MIKCYCDLCGKETDDNEYELPIMNREGEFMKKYIKEER